MNNEVKIKAFVKALIDRVGKSDHKTTVCEIEKVIKEFRYSPSRIEIREVYEKYYIDQKINNTFRRYMINRVARSESGVLSITILLNSKSNLSKLIQDKLDNIKNISGTISVNFTISGINMLHSLDYREQVMNEIYWTINTFENKQLMLTLKEEIKINMTAKFKIINISEDSLEFSDDPYELN